MALRPSVWHIVSLAAALLGSPALGQMIGPGSKWPLDKSVFAASNPFVDRFGNEPTKCKDKVLNVSVPCKQINLLHAIFMNTGPPHISFALHSGLHMAVKMINEAQEMLPGYELVIHTRDTEWSATTKDMMVADELLNSSMAYVGTIASFNLDGGFVYLLNKLGMPLLTGSISEQMADPTVMPAALTAVVHAGHTLEPIKKLFNKCSWTRVGIVHDPMQFGYEAEKFKSRMEDSGYVVSFSEELNRPSDLDTVIKALKNTRVRVLMVFVEALPMVWLACAMHLLKIGRILVMHWPSIPWFLNAAQAQDDRCKDPNLLLRTMKKNYLGWYPLTYDGAPTEKRLTCHPSTPKDQVLGEVMGYMAETLAAGGAPFGPVAHMAGGFDLSCLLTLYLQHMLFNKSYTVEQVAARTPEIYGEYLDWAWPSFYGGSGDLHFDKIYDVAGNNFAGQRKTNVEIIQINGDDISKSPYLGSPPPWDVGMVFPNYVVNPDGSVEDGFLDTITFEDGNNCPADHFEECPVGEQLVWGQCTPCEPGSFQGSDGDCNLCPLGTSQSEPGQTDCIPCVPGTFSNETGSTQCSFCEPGFSRPAGVPATACLPCDTGTFSTLAHQVEDTGMAKCRLCPHGTFAAIIQSSSCEPCPAGFTTLTVGSSNVIDCQCGDGLYQTAGACQVCPSGLTCPFGSKDSTDAAVKPLLQPGFWSSVDEPLKAFKCIDAQVCPGGQPDNACAPNHVGRSCARCSDGYLLYKGKCLECSPFEVSGLLFPMIPFLISPLVVVAMYRTFNADEARWKHWVKGLTAIAFIALNTYQVVSVLSTPADADSTPPTLRNVLNSLSILNDLISLFKPQCVGVNGFGLSLLLRSVFPGIVFLIFHGTFAGSHLVARVSGKPLGMRLCIVQNLFFSIVFSFFTGIAQAAFMVTVCTPNPSGKSTLVADRSVLCYEGEWNMLLVLGILSILFWCVGFGALFAHAIWMLPTKWHDESFRARWAFLFVKFRPGLGWFSLVVVIKGVLIQIGFMLFGDPLPQIYWTISCVAVYCLLVTTSQPWRIMVINVLDVIANFSIIFLGSMLAQFIELDSSASRSMEASAVIISFGPLPAMLCVGCYVWIQQTSGWFKNQRSKAITEICSGLRWPDEATRRAYLDGLTDFEFNAFRTSTGLILTTRRRSDIEPKVGSVEASTEGSLQVAEPNDGTVNEVVTVDV